MLAAVVRNRFVRTAIETPFVEAGALAAHKLINRTRFTPRELEELRHADMSRRKGVNWILASLIGAPMWEEIFFRAFPSKLLDKYFPGTKKETLMQVGVPISAIFAMVHITNVPPKFRGKFIPVSQFMMGCYFWYVMRKRGAMPAIMSHSEMNALIPVFEKIFKF